jgi:hypothetical protein
MQVLVFGLFEVKRRKLLFGLIAIVLCVVIVASTMTALTLTPAIKTTIELLTPLPDDCISAQQAIRIAENYTNQYAKQNNRTVTEIKAVFGLSFYNYGDIASTNPDDLANRTTVSVIEKYYMWTVTSIFQKIAPENTFIQSALDCNISGYLVSLWAHSGQIESQGQIIFVNQLNLYDNLQVTARQGLASMPKSYVSAEQAIHTATSYLTQYLSDKNRTVTEIDAALYMVPDINGKRSSDSYARYPLWDVTVYFNESAHTSPYFDFSQRTQQWYIYGYTVEIWADNAQVCVNEELHAI